MKMDISNFGKYGLPNGGGVVHAHAVMRYVAGCFIRERQRITANLQKLGVEPAILQSITDDSEDFHVFHWLGPEMAPAD